MIGPKHDAVGAQAVGHRDRHLRVDDRLPYGHRGDGLVSRGVNGVQSGIAVAAVNTPAEMFAFGDTYDTPRQTMASDRGLDWHWLSPDMPAELKAGEEQQH